MSENIISWTPCRIKYPPKEGRYFVTIKGIIKNYVIIRSYPDNDWIREDIIAWAEIPKPYDKRRKRGVKFKWHPYPKYRPTCLAGAYLVTDIYKKKREISISIWYESQNKFNDEDIFSVIAWAEMPEPYNEENNG